MPFTDVTEPVAQIVQSAAIIVGGSWAYAEYVRGRTFRPRARLAITASLGRKDTDPVLLVRVSMENQGLGRLPLEKDMSLVYVDDLPVSRWAPGATVHWDESKPIMVIPVFARHEWIEPGETITDNALLPLPRFEDAVAYQARAWVRAPRRFRKSGIAWSANAVVPVEMRMLASTTETTDT